ncbi:hypothetical protein Sjap_004419 [Stephania japonica]|uniref:Reverse transcriptase RNase H-like domain-containing protein n=1 Tax=Stephania japonica TaxID=461633 RepID=A0AAP0K2I3_9MAGN
MLCTTPRLSISNINHPSMAQLPSRLQRNALLFFASASKPLLLPQSLAALVLSLLVYGGWYADTFSRAQGGHRGAAPSNPHTVVPPTSHLRMPKLEIRIFSGENPLDRLFQIERFFLYHQTPLDQRLSVASFYMPSLALQWFHWMYSTAQLTAWSEFARAVEIRFGPSSYVNFEATLFKLKQTSSLDVFMEEFASLSMRTTDLSQDNLLSCFISWVKMKFKRSYSCCIPSATKVFEALKTAVMSTPILALPNFSEAFTVQTNASCIGIGAVLLQANHPMAYFSRVVSPRMRMASTYIREFYAITEAVWKWRQYLLGRRFTIITDHQSLRSILTQTIHTPEQQRWIVKLLGYDFDIIHKSGASNIPAYALSRCVEPEFNSLHSISHPVSAILLALKDFFKSNPVDRTLWTD